MDLLSCYLFKGLADRQLAHLTTIASVNSFQQGEWLFHKGEPAERLYLIEKGAVELLIEVHEGIEIPISMIRPHDGCVGVSALVEPYRYSLSARCIQDGTLFIIKRSDIMALVEKDPYLGHIVMANLARKLLERLNDTRQEVQMRFMSLVRSTTF
jgi:CRP-like cAMP-binding protein